MLLLRTFETQITLLPLNLQFLHFCCLALFLVPVISSSKAISLAEAH
jgi:hypothetical protein